jgi:hypothetical protein
LDNILAWLFPDTSKSSNDNTEESTGTTVSAATSERPTRILGFVELLCQLAQTHFEPARCGAEAAAGARTADGSNVVSCYPDDLASRLLAASLTIPMRAYDDDDDLTDREVP